MKKSRYNEEHIAFALKQAETGTRVGEVSRKMSISLAPFTTERRNLLVWAWLSLLMRSVQIYPSSLSSSFTSSAGNIAPWLSSLPSCFNFSARLRCCTFCSSPLSVSMRMSGVRFSVCNLYE